MLFEFEDSALEPIFEKVKAGTRLSYEDGVTLWQTPDLLGVGYMANLVRERLNGNRTYFIHNRHINPTNICIHSCQFCAFGVKADHPHAYEKSLQDIFRMLKNIMAEKSVNFISWVDCIRISRLSIILNCWKG